MKDAIKVMLVEDHPEYREILEFMLKKDKSMELSAKFGNAELALRSLQDRNKSDEPDVILLDLNLSGVSGLEAMPWFTKYAPSSKIIILSQSEKESDVLCAMQQGAAGYLLKSSTMDDIKQGIHAVMAGGAILEPTLAKFILKTLLPHLPKASSENSLSDRELEVLDLVADGLSQKEISERLKITAYTVTDHLKHIYGKLEVPNAPAAVSKAHKLGLFPSDTDI